MSEALLITNEENWLKEKFLFCGKIKEEHDKSIRLVFDIWHA